MNGEARATEGYWRYRRTEAHQRFRAARDLLLELRTEPDRAAAAFRWPRSESFNWALEWFDVIAADNAGTALELLPGNGQRPVRMTFQELSVRSDTVACWLRDHGVDRGHRVLVVLDARPELWETLLACLKLGAVVIPCHVGLTARELSDRVSRSGARHVVCLDEKADVAGVQGPRVDGLQVEGLRVAVGRGPRGGQAIVPRPGWHSFPGPDHTDRPFEPTGPTPSDAVAFCYFTSGTTSAPKLVAHSHQSYPIGHLSSMYWNGLLPGDRHVNVSSPGWAKHSWSSLFVPWNAEATIVAPAAGPALPELLPALLDQHRVTSFCAPPSTWKALLPFLRTAQPSLREATSAGEILDPAVADRVEQDWGVRPRDGYGQTETTALIGTPPGHRAPRGRLGRVLPGYRLLLREPGATGAIGQPAGAQAAPGAVEHEVGPGPGIRTGEICIDLTERPVGAMLGYLEGASEHPSHPGYRAEGAPRQATGDLAECDDDGWVRLLGRRDDMFKSFDQRISPLELEAVLATHPRVLETAVIPLPDPVGGHVPHAVVVPRVGTVPGPALARELLDHAARGLAEALRPRSVTFIERLPRTVTGKINRAALRSSVPSGGSIRPSAPDGGLR
jgi:acetyl-CoA synthetase